MNTCTASRGQTGFSLIEVLVTVVIIAVGLLGIAALQFMSKRSNFDAKERMIATQLAYDFIARMRANPTQLFAYAGDATNPSPTLGYGSSVATAEPSQNCVGSNVCAPNALATHDIWEFQDKLLGSTEVSNINGTSTNAGGLTNPIACVMTTVSAGLTDRSGEYIIAIAWRGNVQMADPQNPVTPTPNPDPYACGRDTGPIGSGPYDPPNPTGAALPASAKNSYRRILVLDSYVSGPNQ